MKEDFVVDMIVVNVCCIDIKVLNFVVIVVDWGLIQLYLWCCMIVICDAFVIVWIFILQAFFGIGYAWMYWILLTFMGLGNVKKTKRFKCNHLLLMPEFPEIDLEKLSSITALDANFQRRIWRNHLALLY